MASLLEKYGWREWLCHTNFSFLMGTSHPGACLKTAFESGYKGLAITDFNGAYGLARGYRTYKNLPHSFEYYYGAEVNLTKDHHFPIVQQDTLVLMAQSKQGYCNLNKLLTYSHRDGKKDATLPMSKILSSDVKDIVLLQPMRGLMRHENGLSQVEKRILILRDHFKGRVYQVLSRHYNPAEDYQLRDVVEMIKRHDLPHLMSQDVFFHQSKQKKLSDLLQAIRHNKTVEESVDQMFINSERSLQSLLSIERRYQGLELFESSLKYSQELGDSCRFSMEELYYQYPKEMIPEGHSAQSWLEALVWQGTRRIYGDLIPDKVNELLHKEISLIKELGFADYFLTVWDIVRWAREQKILCQGRGSAANSVICFVLGVTSVNPVHFDLLFERFLSVERGDPPDIDVDFEHERREEVIQYIYGRYGRKRAAMVANVITFKKKGALRFSAKALGIKEEEIKKANALLRTKAYRGHPIDQILAQVASDKEVSSDVPWKLWGEMAMAIKGLPRHLGIHSGGFIIAEHDLDELAPQEPATMEGRSVIQWCKEDIEALNFFKIDVLALGMLSALRKSLNMIQESYGEDMTLATIPQDDGPTYKMIQKADTVGTFQIESRAQMSMLPRLRPKCFYDLVVEVAIIRPGPIQGGVIHPYLKRRDGVDPVVYPDPALEPILKRTLGIPIFQEQVMRIAMAIGGFSPGEADELRRQMGAWNIKGDLTPYMKKLDKGMRAYGIAEEFIQIILGQMSGFADYGFPESHSVSFALLAYASSWVKCHYPAAFVAGLLNSQPMGFYSPHTLVQTARRSGVEVYSACINRSSQDALLEKESSHDTYAIRLGLRLVNSLGQPAIDKILRVRAEVGGRWSSYEHFLKTCSLDRGSLMALAAANAFKDLGVTRRDALWIAVSSPYEVSLEDREGAVFFDEETRLEEIQMDLTHTNVTLGEHPAEVIKNNYWNYQVPIRALQSPKELENMQAGAAVTVFGILIIRQAPPSAKGMVFLTLECSEGFFNIAFTPQVYRKYLHSVEGVNFVCVTGKLQRDNVAHSILARHVYDPLEAKAEVRSLEHVKRYKSPGAREPVKLRASSGQR